jgi:hypothetical protein
MPTSISYMCTMTLREHPKRSTFLHVLPGCVLSHYLNSYKDQVYISACISSMSMVIFHALLCRPIFCWCLQHSYIFASSDVKINDCTDWAQIVNMFCSFKIRLHYHTTKLISSHVMVKRHILILNVDSLCQILTSSKNHFPLIANIFMWISCLFKMW